MTQSATVTKLAKVWRWVGKVKKHVTTLQKGLRIQGTRNGSIFNIVSPVNGFTNVGWLKLDAVVVTPPPVEPPPSTDYPRIVWDDQNPDYNYKCRTQMPGWDSVPTPPAVMRHYPVCKEGAGDFRYNISDWKQLFLDINGGDVQRFDYWTKPSTAQFNRTGWPTLANLTFCGNAIYILEEVDGWIKFETLKTTDLERAKGMTIETHPHLVHSFHCVGFKNGETTRVLSTNTPRGKVYFHVVTELGYAWIPARNVVKAK